MEKLTPTHDHLSSFPRIPACARLCLPCQTSDHAFYISINNCGCQIFRTPSKAVPFLMVVRLDFGNDHIFETSKEVTPPELNACSYRDPIQACIHSARLWFQASYARAVPLRPTISQLLNALDQTLANYEPAPPKPDSSPSDLIPLKQLSLF